MNSTKTVTLTLGLFLIFTLELSSYSTTFFKQQDHALAQQNIPTIKYRNLVIDLGNGLKTNAQLTFPVEGNGPFPAVLLIHGSGALNMNETTGLDFNNNGPKPYWQIAQYLSERGFAVIRYDKRGVGANGIIDQNVWGNATVNDLIHDAGKVLNVLMQQPEVDPQRISVLGHSEGTVIAPRVAIDNSAKVKNVILMGAAAQSLAGEILRYQVVDHPLEYATQVLDKNHTGLVSIQQIANDPLLGFYLISSSLLDSNNTKAITDGLTEKFGTTDQVSIEKQIRPALIKYYENETAFDLSKCSNIRGCPIWFRSELNLMPTLSIIGNISNSTGILLLNGENDSQTTVQQAFLLQQRLTDVGHPDHTLITYPNLGHFFYPSPEWFTEPGPIEPYVLTDLYAWLEAHSGLSYPYLAPPFGNMTSKSTDIGSNSSTSEN